MIVRHYIQNSSLQVGVNHLEIHYIILVIHLIVGLALVYLATKAFKKTKYPPMAFLAIGFALIVVGDTIIERKTTSDFISSMLNKRLLTQLKQMKKYKEQILIEFHTFEQLDK